MDALHSRTQSMDGIHQGLNHVTMDSIRTLIMQWMDFTRPMDSLGRKWINHFKLDHSVEN
jgi:hypothetical protein